MNVKERPRSSSFLVFSRILKGFLGTIKGKTFKIIVKTILIIFILLIGFGLGLLFSGFFGTLDSPSKHTLSLMGYFGIDSPITLKAKIDNVMAENIKIPINYVVGQFSNPEEIFINIDFEDYQKIVEKRNEALELGTLITTSNDSVPASIRYNDKEVKVKLRLKGDWIDHISGDKWSFRIQVRGEDTLFGMKTFSIQDPKTRGYLDEYFYQEVLKREEVIGLRYKFIDVTINGEYKGVYALEEHFNKELIEDNQRREGVYVKFDEDKYRDYLLIESLFPSSDSDKTIFYPIIITDTFDIDNILPDPAKTEQFRRASALLESFRAGQLKASDVFDIEKTSKYFAVSAILGAQHGTSWHNTRWYYNPVTSRLEPIGFDGGLRVSTYRSDILEIYFAPCLENIKSEISFRETCKVDLTDFEQSLFRDPIIYSAYIKNLERISKTEYLDELLKSLDQNLSENLQIIHKDTPSYHFTDKIFKYNQEYLSKFLVPEKPINVYIQKQESSQIKTKIGNRHKLPIEIISLTYNEEEFPVIENQNILQPFKNNEITYSDFSFAIPSGRIFSSDELIEMKVNYKVYGTENIGSDFVLPWEYYDSSFAEEDFFYTTSSTPKEFLEINEASKTILIKRGSWQSSESIIIPKGYVVLAGEDTKIDLTNGALLLSYSPINFIGSQNKPIEIYSSDKTGQGVTILDADTQSRLENVVFRDMTYPKKNGWELTGAINFYESPVIMNGVSISGMNAEDSLNIIRSKFDIFDLEIKDSFSDCLDIDFGEGTIRSSTIENCGNDALDFSGSKVVVSDFVGRNLGDKGISVGEQTTASLYNIQIENSFIGITSKDKSNVYAENVSLENTKYDFSAYKKKPEFGPAFIEAFKVKIINSSNGNLIEKGSSLSIDDSIIPGSSKDVDKNLYGDEE